MIRRPRLEDHLVIGKYTGKLIVGVGLLMLAPLAVSLVFAEWDTALDFVISISACLIFGLGVQLVFRTDRDMSWSHGLAVTSGTWIWATALGALPHWLSGHAGSFLDATFDSMSGFTTTGFYLLQDLDHVAIGLNMWRHVLTYAGGQGIVVIALTFMFKGTAGAYRVYVGEGREDRLLPNVINTARAIWLVSLTWLVVGTIAFTLAGLYVGQQPVRAFLHGMWVFMGAWSTGGFAPQSFNTFWFHSLVYEVLTFVLFIIGSFNFALHWAMWTGDRKEIRRNIETISFFISGMTAVMVTTFWLAREGIYPDAMSLFRKAFYQIASAHTATGLSTMYPKTFVTQWGTLGLVVMIVVMSIGASASSTGGGIKNLRVGIIAKALAQDVRRMVLPGSAVFAAGYHHIRDTLLNDRAVRAALTVTMAFITLHVTGTLVGVLYGLPLDQAAFEAVSAGSTTGLSCGVTSPTMPWLLKSYYILSMWVGRLEFMSVFALFGFGWGVLRGK